MTPRRLILFERLAWIEGYLSHYAAHGPAAVLDALEASAIALDEARQLLRVSLSINRGRGDLELERRYGAEVMRAIAVIAHWDLTLDEAALFLAGRPRDEGGLPDLSLPVAVAGLRSSRG
ncbi:MAG: hypothetical protein HOV80_19210 [Polyangiaceae bacterium]|nr:hypothetical protein [Polyangiaceae bacterium]